MMPFSWCLLSVTLLQTANPVMPSASAEAAPLGQLQFPVIPNLGGVVWLADAAEPPRRGSKLVLDVTAETVPGEVNKGLERAARVLNLYGAAGLKPTDLELTMVFHGKATFAILKDAQYEARFAAGPNPNLSVVQQLQKAGVKIYVCGQSLQYNRLSRTDIGTGLPVTLAAVILVANRQADGFSYLPIP